MPGRAWVALFPLSNPLGVWSIPKTTVGSSVPGSDKVSVWLTGAAAPKKSTGTTDLRQEADKIACLLSSLKLSVGEAQTTKWVAPFLEKL